MLDSGRGAMIAVIARNVKSCFEQTLTLWRNPLECAWGDAYSARCS
jgi:hypothetical protein